MKKQKLIFMILFFSKFLCVMSMEGDMPQYIQPQDQQSADSQPQDMPTEQPLPQQYQPQPQEPATYSQSQAQQEPPANYDQLKWPDSIELTEGQGDIVKSNDPKIIELSKKASQLADQLKVIANNIKVSVDKVNQEMMRINGALDSFYQTSGFDEGKARAMLK